MRLPARSPAGARAAFTLAEVAVTLLIVAIGLTLVLQGLSTAKFSAADTHYRRLARELALLTLGQVEAGLFWEDFDGGGDTLSGTYAEEGHEEVSYELVTGDQEFYDAEQGYDESRGGYHDSWEAERQREERLQRDDPSDEEDEVTEPFEKVRIKVFYPKFGERQNSLVMERWIPWEQVYGAAEDAERPAAAGVQQ